MESWRLVKDFYNIRHIKNHCCSFKSFVLSFNDSTQNFKLHLKRFTAWFFSNFRNAFRQYLCDKYYCEKHRLCDDMKYIQGGMMFFLYLYFRIDHNRNAWSLFTRYLQTRLIPSNWYVILDLCELYWLQSSQQKPVLTAPHTWKFEWNCKLGIPYSWKLKSTPKSSI